MKILVVLLTLFSANAFAADIDNALLTPKTMRDDFGNCVYRAFQNTLEKETGYFLGSTDTYGPSQRFVTDHLGDVTIDTSRARFDVWGRNLPSITLVHYFVDFRASINQNWQPIYANPQDDMSDVVALQSPRIMDTAVIGRINDDKTELDLYYLDIGPCKVDLVYR